MSSSMEGFSVESHNETGDVNPVSLVLKLVSANVWCTSKFLLLFPMTELF